MVTSPENALWLMGFCSILFLRVSLGLYIRHLEAEVAATELMRNEVLAAMERRLNT